MSIILGIDPGTTTTGFAVLDKQGKNLEILSCGIIETKIKEKLDLKLFDIGKDIDFILKKYKPSVCCIEKIFFLKNIKTGIDVAHARGVMIYLISKKGIPIKEYTPLQVKQGICGNGKADKKQVQKALKCILKLDSIPTPDDAADALAIAYLGSLEKSK